MTDEKKAGYIKLESLKIKIEQVINNLKIKIEYHERLMWQEDRRSVCFKKHEQAIECYQNCLTMLGQV